MANEKSKKIKDKRNQGFGLVEIIVVTAMISGVFFAFSQAQVVSVKLLRGEKEYLEATLLAQEALEAVRSVRDESWTLNIATLANGATYYPVVQNGKWALTITSPGLINGKYTREIIFSEVYRNTQDKIAVSGTLDANTKLVTAKVSWSGKTKELKMYSANFLETLGGQQEVKTIFFEGGTTDADLVNFPSNNSGNGDPAQGFTTVSAIQASKVELYLKRVTASPSNIYVELRQTPTGAILGTSNTITSSTISNSLLSWVEFRFPSAVSLSATTNYYIRLHSIPSSTDASSGSAGTIHWGYQQTPPSPYAGGVGRRYIGRLSNPNDSGQSLDQYDFSFRVYAVQ